MNTASIAPVAVVTGASSGIGRASAEALATAGYRVVGSSRKASSVSPLEGVTFFDLDISSDESVASFVDRVLIEFGTIDVLVNNAGVGIVGAAEETSITQAKQVFDVNFFGTLRVITAVLPILRAKGSGRIVNISSVLGFLPAPYMALYAASKHALEGYTESLDHEVRGMGVRAVLVQPAFTNTGFDAGAMKAELALDEYASQRRTAEEFLRLAGAAGDDPSVVGRSVVSAATDKSPRLRYRSGQSAKQIGTARRVLPASVFDKQVRKLNKLAG